MSKALKRAKEIILNAKREINQILSGPEHIQSLDPINTHFRGIETRLTYIQGVLEPEANAIASQAAAEQFPPIKNFMGNPISQNKRVKASDLTPNETAKQIFLNKVNKLWDDIVTMKPADVLKTYTLPEDITVLRGVAKRSGITSFADNPLTIKFIEDIQIGVEIKNEETATQQRINDNLAKMEGAETVTVTDKNIKKLTEQLGTKIESKLFAPGSKVIVYKDGTIDLVEEELAQ